MHVFPSQPLQVPAGFPAKFLKDAVVRRDNIQGHYVKQDDVTPADRKGVDAGKHFERAPRDVNWDKDSFRLHFWSSAPITDFQLPSRPTPGSGAARSHGVAQDAEIGVVGVLLDEFAHLVECQAAGLGDAFGLEAGVLQTDVGSRPLAEPVTASAGTGRWSPDRSGPGNRRHFGDGVAQLLEVGPRLLPPELVGS